LQRLWVILTCSLLFSCINWILNMVWLKKISRAPTSIGDRPSILLKTNCTWTGFQLKEHHEPKPSSLYIQFISSSLENSYLSWYQTKNIIHTYSKKKLWFKIRVHRKFCTYRQIQWQFIYYHQSFANANTYETTCALTSSQIVWNSRNNNNNNNNNNRASFVS